MEFVFDEEKATEAAAYLLELAGGTLDAAMLMNLLYLADRQSLIETGMTITGGQMIVTDYGAGLVEIVDLIHGTKRAATWNATIATTMDRGVELASPRADYRRLARFDTQTLAELWAKYAPQCTHLTPDVLNLVEFHDCQRESPIVDHRLILRGAGFDEEDIAFVEDRAEGYRSLRAVLG
ncbi:MAG: type II toxin-antitoxin system antitoxin SocA domain-containing protein [Dehalococcoidia bacterium]